MNRIASLLVAAAALATAQPAMAVEKYLGEVFLTAATFCPRGSMEANGAMLDIRDHTALFSLLGTTYGGDGRVTFLLPDLRNHAPVGQGDARYYVKREMGSRGSQDNKVYGVAEPEGNLRSSVQGTQTLAMRYCVVTEGIFPSRG